MQAAARARLNGEVGAMWEATEGAVVIELLGHQRMRSSLVYPDHQVHYDFISDLHELYDLRKDPWQEHDLFDRRPDLARRFERLMRRYRDLRARAARYSLGRRPATP